MKVLIFGGNGFLGAETVGILLDSGIEVTVANRGRSWDWDTLENIKPRVNCLFVDRDKPLDANESFCQHVLDTFYDVTIDFSGYKPKALKETITLMKGHTDLYIYISSDSVYEVCLEKQHNEPTRETDAIRPTNERERRRASRRDSYGDDKLSSEEALVEDHRKGASPPYIILRLADVIGPKDSTDRFWQYLIWIEIASKCKDLYIAIPKAYESVPLSFVYSKDIAFLIKQIIYMDSESRKRVINESYNLSCTENINLNEFLDVMTAALGLKFSQIEVKSVDGDEVPHIYPSVDKGSISITKAISRLNWNPTSLDIAISATVDYYVNVVKKDLFVNNRKEMFKTLKESLADMFDKHTVKKHLKDTLRLK